MGYSKKDRYETFHVRWKLTSVQKTYNLAYILQLTGRGITPL